MIIACPDGQASVVLTHVGRARGRTRGFRFIVLWRCRNQHWPQAGLAERSVKVRWQSINRRFDLSPLAASLTILIASGYAASGWNEVSFKHRGERAPSEEIPRCPKQGSGTRSLGSKKPHLRLVRSSQCQDQSRHSRLGGLHSAHSAGV